MELIYRRRSRRITPWCSSSRAQRAEPRTENMIYGAARNEDAFAVSAAKRTRSIPALRNPHSFRYDGKTRRADPRRLSVGGGSQCQHGQHVCDLVRQSLRAFDIVGPFLGGPEARLSGSEFRATTKQPRDHVGAVRSDSVYGLMDVHRRDARMAWRCPNEPPRFRIPKVSIRFLRRRGGLRHRRVGQWIVVHPVVLGPPGDRRIGGIRADLHLQRVVHDRARCIERKHVVRSGWA